jgi:hypothetical protein
MSDCLHNELKRLEGPLHPRGKDYVCQSCGQQFRAEPLSIGVGYGKPRASRICHCGHSIDLHDDQAVCRALVDGKKSCQCMQYDTRPQP